MCAVCHIEALNWVYSGVKTSQTWGWKGGFAIPYPDLVRVQTAPDHQRGQLGASCLSFLSPVERTEGKEGLPAGTGKGKGQTGGGN